MARKIFWAVLIVVAAAAAGIVISNPQPLRRILGETAATATLSPTITPSPTVTPLPTQTPLPEVKLDVSSDMTQIAADGRSQAALTVNISNPSQVDLSGLSVSFRVEGGGTVQPDSLPILSDTLSAAYTAGETSAVTSVKITALLDVPRLGRVEDVVTIDMIRQEVTAVLPCAYFVVSNTVNTPLEFRLAERNNTGLSGIYEVHLSLTGNSPGTLTADSETSPQLALTLPLGTQQVLYTPPALAAGNTEVCVEFLERPEQAAVCTPLIWGPPDSQVALEARPFTSWTQAVPPRVRLSAWNPNTIPIGSLSYQWLVSDKAPGSLLLNDVPVLPNECLPMSLGNEVILPFIPKAGSGVIQWRAELPGGQIAESISVLAADRLTFLDSTRPLTWVSRQDAFLFLDAPDPNLWMFSTKPFHEQSPITPLLIRFYVLDEYVLDGQIQPSTTEIPVNSSLENYQGLPNGKLILNADPLAIAVFAPIEIIINDQSEVWYEVYALMLGETAALQKINLSTP